MNKNSKIFKLTECSILIAMATVLSLIKIIHLPLGGSITLLSMLPICIISYRHGLGWGFLSSFVYSIIQLIFGLTIDGLLGWGLTPAMLVGCIAFDYIIAYSILGIAGLFRKKGEIGYYIGIVIAFVLRFLSHFVSGYVIFTNLEQWAIFGSTFENAPVLYSICYNGFFMLPELLITFAVSVVLMRFPAFKKALNIKETEKFE